MSESDFDIVDNNIPNRLSRMAEMQEAQCQFILKPSEVSLAMLRLATTRWIAEIDGYDWDAKHWNWYRRWCEGYYRQWADTLILGSPVIGDRARKFWKALAH